MTALKFYYDLLSQPSRAVLIFLKLNRIQFEDHPIALRKGEHQSNGYKAINPFASVPFLDDDSFRLSESVAMLKYLHNKYATADHWYPAGLREKARVDEYLAWQHTNLRLHGTMVFRVQVVEPRSLKRPIDEAKLQYHSNELNRCLNQIENIFLNTQPYLCGHSLSVADLLGACEIMQPLSVKFPILTSSRPKLCAWFDKIHSDTQPYFDMVHKPLKEVAKRWLANQQPSSTENQNDNKVSQL